MAYTQLNVAETPYRTMQDRFGTHARLKNGDPLQGAQVEIAWPEFTALFTHAVEPGDGLAVKVHYGLSGKDIVYGFSQVYMQNMGEGQYALSVLDYHLLSAGRFVPTSQANISALVENYLQNVEVKRTPTGGFSPLVPGVDPEAAITPYELELLMMYNENQQRYGGAPSDYKVRISSLFDVDAGGGDFRQSIGFNLLMLRDGAWQTMLDDTYASPTSFLMKASDMANPCPPGCLTYQVR